MSTHDFFILGPNPRVYVPKGKELFEVIDLPFTRTIEGDKVTYHLSARVKCNVVGVEDIQVIRLTDEEKSDV